MEVYKVKLTFTEDLLGTVPLNKEIYKEHVAKQVEADDLGEELSTIEELEEKGTTGFHKVDGQPVLYDYVCRGFLKAACGAMRRLEDSKSRGLKAYKRIIDQLVFVKPRKIPV